MRKKKKYYPPNTKTKKYRRDTSWKTIVFLCCAFLAVAYIGIYGTDFLNPLNSQISQLTQGSGTQVSNYQSSYRIGSVATDQSGTKGYAIVSDGGGGQYEVIQVFLDQSKKGWHTNGPGTRVSLNYQTVEQNYPVVWPGGIMDITHIPEKDWSLPENWNSGSGPGYTHQNTASTSGNPGSTESNAPRSNNLIPASVEDRIPSQLPVVSNLHQNIADPVTDILNRHNYYRSAVTGANIPNLVWSSTVAASAQNYADYLGANNLFEHSKGSYSENLAAGYPSWTAAIDGWGSEKSNFIYAPFGNGASKTGNWKDIGHYTQVIWKTTTQCGCGSAPHPTWGTVYVCQYSPAGNIVGYYPY